MHSGADHDVAARSSDAGPSSSAAAIEISPSSETVIQSLQVEQPATCSTSPGLISWAWSWLTGTGNPQDAARDYANAVSNTTEDFSDLDAVGFLRTGLRDKKGRPVVMVVAKYFQAKALDKQRVYMYIVRKLDAIADSEYSVVWVHTTATYWENCPSITWLLSTYERLPPKYRSNLATVYVLHSDLSMWGAVLLLGPWLSAGFWNKVEWLLRLEFLWDHVVEEEASSVPEFVAEHDAMLEEHPLLDYGLAHVREGWMPAGPAALLPPHLVIPDDDDDVHVPRQGRMGYSQGVQPVVVHTMPKEAVAHPPPAVVP